MSAVAPIGRRRQPRNCGGEAERIRHGLQVSQPRLIRRGGKISSFQFPVSSFQFQVSSFQFPVSTSKRVIVREGRKPKIIRRVDVVHHSRVRFLAGFFNRVDIFENILSYSVRIDIRRFILQNQVKPASDANGSSLYRLRNSRKIHPPGDEYGTEPVRRRASRGFHD